MKKTFKITVKIKKCDIEFKKGMGKGVIGTEELEYSLEEKQYDRPGFVMSLMEKADTLRNDLIEYTIEEIE